MELKIKNKNKIKREKGPTRNKKWGILKYLSAEISFEKSEAIQSPTTRVSGVLGKKLGYDRYVCHVAEINLRYSQRFDSARRSWLGSIHPEGNAPSNYNNCLTSEIG